MNKGQEIKQLKKEAAIAEAISDQAIASCVYHTKLDMTSMACQFVSSEIKTSYMYEKHENIIKAKTPKPHQSPYAKNVQRAVSQKTAQKAQDRNLSAYSNALGQSDIQKAIANNFAKFDEELFNETNYATGIAKPTKTSFWGDLDNIWHREISPINKIELTFDRMVYGSDPKHWDTSAYTYSNSSITDALSGYGKSLANSGMDFIYSTATDIEKNIYGTSFMPDKNIFPQITISDNEIPGVRAADVTTALLGGIAAGEGIAGAMSKMGFFGRTAGVGDEMLGAEDTAARRDYLNAKFDRTGNLNVDISKRGYLENLNKYSFEAPSDSKIFYSGPANNLKADIYAQSTGKTTIDKLPGGVWLKNQAVYKKFDQDAADDIWRIASSKYSFTAKGDVFVFSNGASPTRIFNVTERPILETNPAVTSINYLDHPYLDVEYDKYLGMGN